MSLNDAIQTMIDNTLNQQPKPQRVTITKVYTGNTHIDCKNSNGDILTYIPVIANNPTVNNIGILLFLENNEKIIITK